MASKVALVTGAAKRIGEQTVRTLHEHGYNVIIHYRSSKQQAQSLADTLNALRHSSAAIMQADLNDDKQIASFAESCLRVFGRIDVLVNNASTFYPTSFNTANISQWDDLFASNAKAPFFLIQALQKPLAENKGCVINMIDIHAERPLKAYPIYCMAKASLAMLTKSLSRELAPNIRVNGVAPGAILWHENDLTDDDKQAVLKDIPLERMGSPLDIAETILFLANAPYITGQIIAVDGGRSLGGAEKA